MEQTTNFLSILNSMIHHTTLKLAEPVDYAQLLSIARAHNVYALVCEKLCEDPKFKKQPEYGRYIMTTMSMVAAQAQRTSAFLELYRAFSEQGIFPVVMKGLVCRRLYGEFCDHRPSGDEDILIEKSDFEKAKAVLTALGYSPEREEVTARQLDEIQEVGFRSSQTGLYIELHVNPMGYENHLRSRMNDYFRTVFERSIEVEYDGVRIRTMSHTDHFLYLVLHAFRHFTAGGFGIRQVLDILLYEERYASEIDLSYIEQVLKEVHAEGFLADLTVIGNQYLGFSLPMLTEPRCPSELLFDLMSNGVFGNGTQPQRTAYNVVSAAVLAQGGGQGRWKTLLHTVFPSRSQMVGAYPELVEKPWILPVLWIRRFLRFFRRHKNQSGALAAESMEIGKRRIALLKKYDIL